MSLMLVAACEQQTSSPEQNNKAVIDTETKTMETKIGEAKPK